MSLVKKENRKHTKPGEGVKGIDRVAANRKFQVKHTTTKQCIGILQEKEEDSTCEYCNELERQNAELRQQIKDLKYTNVQLLDQLKQKVRKITTYIDGKYADNVRICVIELSITQICN